MRARNLLLLFISAGLAAADPATFVGEMKQVLTDNILDFWHPKSIDRKYGGYTIRFGPDGAWLGDGPKALVTQARMVWFFARMARAGYGDRKQMLEAADHGYRFLTTKMWDAANGGFAWEVDATGERKTRPMKHMYGQSFALYAMSELALASGRKDVLALAETFFDLWERKAHDKQFGGYQEFFDADWTPAPAATPGYMAGGGGIKLMNTHLHLLEALATFYRASKLPLARERLYELMAIETNAVVRKGLGACTDQYERDWTPRLGGDLSRVSYGHDLENVWLIADAADALGVPVAPYIDLFKELWAYSLKYGWDAKDGGFWYMGPFNAPADNRTKSWWVQSEALVSALWMHRLTGDKKYYEIFEKTWDFVKKYQIDGKHGEWWSTVDEKLGQSGEKGGPWKAAYHNGRAMIEAIILLSAVK
jgi:mannobiose 2-epimerase